MLDATLGAGAGGHYVALVDCAVRKEWPIYVTFQKFLIIEEFHWPLKLRRVGRNS